MLFSLYRNIILKYPKALLTVIVAVSFFMAFNALKLEIDASAQTLLLEGDKDLKFNREVSKKFTAGDFLIVTYSNGDDLLSLKNIENIKLLSEQLSKIEFVESITNIVNVPLLQSPTRPLNEVMKNIYTIESKEVDKQLAKKELLNSPIYKNNLVSDDFKTTAILVNLKEDKKYFTLIEQNDNFLQIKQQRKLTPEEKRSYEEVKKSLKSYRDVSREKTHNNILQIREILKSFQEKNNVTLHLGGTTMIADDMVEFVKYDLKVFGMGIVLLLLFIIYILFKEFKWVLLPLFISFISIIVTSGFLGIFGWEITVISSNFISLQLIMNISLVIHLIIKYKELHLKYPKYDQEELVLNSVLLMAKPSFFVVITTVAGFSSLVFSHILPVINFGWMMSLGIAVSLVCTFLLFPLILVLFGKSDRNILKKDSKPFTAVVGEFALKNQSLILISTFAAVIFSISGTFKLKVENSFIDYFKESTEIYKGMKIIDQKLGGTTPLDIIITFKQNSDEIKDIKIEEQNSEFDEFLDEFEQTKEDKKDYWFTTSKLEKIEAIHDYLESLPQIGKVLSLKTVTQIGKSLNGGKDLDSFSLSLIYKELPQKYKNIIITPYVNIEHNTARISTRIIDSLPKLQRDALVKQIDNHIKTIIDPKFEEYRLSNLLIMYNNMLQSLFDSQIKTIGVVVVILFLMFLILFQSFKLATVAIIVNIVPVSVIFGVMGWFEIPLDMMTITIAAISIGIAVDDTIHYIHRFTSEIKQGKNYIDAVRISHSSIGVAMFYTSTVIIIGFSILVLSNFIPTIYFGLLTVLAMFMAIAADLLLLPVLLKFLYK